MKQSKFDEFLSQHRIFRIEEVQHELSLDKNNGTFKNLLSYHLKEGHIIRIRRGIYYVVPQGINPGACPVDPYLLCSSLAPDGILAYQSALGFFGKLHSIRRDFTYLTR